MTQPNRFFFGLLLTALAVLPAGATTLDGLRINPGVYPSQVVVTVQNRTYDLYNEGQLRAFASQLRDVIKLSEEQEQARLAAEASGATYRRPKNFVSKDTRRGLVEMAALAEAALQARSDNARQQDVKDALVHIQEIDVAMKNKARSPIPSKIDIFVVPFQLMNVSNNPVGRGRRERAACNLQGTWDNLPDLSSIDPVPSTFWTPPADRSAADFFYGFGRTAVPSLAGEPATYRAAKTSFGTNPGFTIKWQGDTWKVKFGETSTEPFGTRIFWAMGYNVDATDFAPTLAVRYDRRLLTEFNLRKAATTKLTFLFVIPIRKIKLQKYRDPFASISAAVLKDGSRIEGKDFRNWILANPAKGERAKNNFRTDREPLIDVLEYRECNLQRKDADSKILGRWDWDQFNHPDRRELRGAGMLAAWLCWFDARWDNTRLELVKVGDRQELRHAISDLGSVLGRASKGLGNKHGGDVNRFTWTCTAAAANKDGQRSVAIANFQTLEDNKSFYSMNLDDARWMARKMAPMTEEQIFAALMACGFSGPEVVLYREKLVSRRDNMVKDLGLAEEIPLLRPSGVNQKICYDVKVDGPLTLTLADGTVVTAPDEGTILQDGMVKPRL